MWYEAARGKFCELRGAHVHLRNSWRADLDDMLANLAKDGIDARYA